MLLNSAAVHSARKSFVCNGAQVEVPATRSAIPPLSFRRTEKRASQLISSCYHQKPEAPAIATTVEVVKGQVVDRLHGDAVAVATRGQTVRWPQLVVSSGQQQRAAGRPTGPMLTSGSPHGRSHRTPR